MHAAIAGAALLTLILGWNARSPEIESSTAIVPNGSNPVLTVANFVRIRQFILSQARRRTYCNMFNDNPYWPFFGFNAYLNPADPTNINCEIGKFEFNSLVIQVTAPHTKYWDIILDVAGKELRVRQYYATRDPQVLIQEATEFFRHALAEVEQQTKRGEPEEREPAAGKWRRWGGTLFLRAATAIMCFHARPVARCAATEPPARG
ncbi:MAG: hypothetical protein ACLQKA_06540 [Bryobacteraceae bacterium]